MEKEKCFCEQQKEHKLGEEYSRRGQQKERYRKDRGRVTAVIPEREFSQKPQHHFVVLRYYLKTPLTTSVPQTSPCGRSKEAHRAAEDECWCLMRHSSAAASFHADDGQSSGKKEH